MIADRLRRLREWVEFDSTLFRTTFAFGALVYGGLCLIFRRFARAYAILTRLHQAAFSRLASSIIENHLKRALSADGTSSSATGLARVLRQHNAGAEPTPVAAKFIEDPRKLLGHRAIVLKSARPGEKGVVLLKYSYVFPLFLQLFDVRRIVERYYLVLEPSWNGVCDLDILCTWSLGSPVFVQTTEPRDISLLESISDRLIPVPIAANWWVDHRIFAPQPKVEKDVDVIMVANWDPIKRHHRFFAALQRLQQEGARPRVVLIGYSSRFTLNDIVQMASFHGVDGLIEFHETLPAEEVSRHLNRAKVHVLWSRRECANRAIIEAMLTGVPCILREGLSYGHKYPYINATTGRFSTESALPQMLSAMIRDHAKFEPRQWVLEHMSCQLATQALGQTIGQYALRAGENWTGGLAVKTNRVDTMHYWNPLDRQRFEPDYAYLASAIRE